MIDLMNGAHAARKYVNDYLAHDIPRRLVTYRNGWNLDSTALPDPVEYIYHEPLAIDEWPTVITTVLSTNQVQRIEWAYGNPLYRVSYSMRTYVWVKADDSLSCGIMRDRLTTVLRAAFLDYPCLKAFDSRTSFRAVIDESSIREEFSDITLLKGDRVMSGAFISYTLEMDEVVAREDVGEVDEIELIAVQVGNGEEFPDLGDL
jgi:hypothetical protein